MTTNEAAKRLGMPVQVVRCMMRAGNLPIGIARKNRKEWSYYIIDEWLDRFIAGNPVEMGRAI